jgi:lysophospholipase L1-like esterase
MDAQGNWVAVVSDTQVWNGSYSQATFDWEKTIKIPITNLTATSVVRTVVKLATTAADFRILNAYNSTVSAASRAAGHTYRRNNGSSTFLGLDMGFAYDSNTFYNAAKDCNFQADSVLEIELESLNTSASDDSTVRVFDTKLGFRQKILEYNRGPSFLGRSFADFIGLQSTGGIDSVKVFNASSPAWSSQTIAYSNAAIYWSPNNWYDSGSAKITHNSGAYFKFKTTSNKIVVVCPSTTVYQRPLELNWSVDGVEQASYPVPYGTSGVTELILSESLGRSLKEIKVQYSTLSRIDTGTAYAEDRWTTSSAHRLVVTGIKIDASASISATTPRPLSLTIFGDSITEQAVPGLAHQGYAAKLADAINAEYSQIAFGYLGIEYEYGADTPAPRLVDSWNLHFQGQSRLTTGSLTPQPDIIAINIGTNDHALGGPVATATFESNLNTILTAMRTAAPTAKVVVIVPFALRYATQIAAAVSGRSNMFVTNLGATGQTFVASPNSDDNLHPNVTGSALAATAIAADWTTQGII